MENNLKVYGADWCPKTAEIKNFLQAEWIDFDYFNVETDEEAQQRMKDIYDGKVKFPTVTKGDAHLKNPKIADIRRFLKEE